MRGRKREMRAEKRSKGRKRNNWCPGSSSWFQWIGRSMKVVSVCLPSTLFTVSKRIGREETQIAPTTTTCLVVFDTLPLLVLLFPSSLSLHFFADDTGTWHELFSFVNLEWQLFLGSWKGWGEGWNSSLYTLLVSTDGKDMDTQILWNDFWKLVFFSFYDDTILFHDFTRLCEELRMRETKILTEEKFNEIKWWRDK